MPRTAQHLELTKEGLYMTIGPILEALPLTSALTASMMFIITYVVTVISIKLKKTLKK